MITDETFIAHKNEKTNETQSIQSHLTNTSCYAKNYLSKINFASCGEVAALLHDLGKYSDKFQERIKEGGDKTDHATFGAKCIYQLFEGLPSENKTKELKTVSDIIALVVMSHHGGLMDVIAADGADFGTDNLKKRIEKYNGNNSEQQFDLIAERSEKIRDKVMELIRSHEFISEYSAVREKLKKFNEARGGTSEEILFFESLFIKFIFSCLIDADRRDTSEFCEGKYDAPRVEWETLIEAAENKNRSFAKNELNNIRNEIYKTCVEYGGREKNFFKIETPTGGGKTLSSFRFALEHAKTHKSERIIYVIPYISIIEQNADVIKKMLEDNNISADILTESHSNININKEDKDENYGLTQNWDSQIIFTTMVGFLESVFGGGTKNIRRFHNMANSVIIFDEIQFMPIKAIHMANMLMNFLFYMCGSSIVLCTATQPLLDKIADEPRRLPEAVNIITKKYPLLDRVEIIDATTVSGYDHNQIIDFAAEKFIGINSMLIVVNTRKSAVELFKLAKDKYGSDVSLYYLSTNLCPQHRSKVICKIKKCLDSGKKTICISTQLIEAGVDIDFNCVIRFTAGLDSIIQSAGRCNREGKQASKGKTYIVNCNCETIDKLEDIREGREIAKRIFDELKKGRYGGDLLSKEAIERYYEYYFHARNDEMCYKLSLDINLFNLMSNNTAAVNEYKRKLNVPQIPMRIRQAFKTAGENFKIIDNDQVGVIVPYEEGKNIICNLKNMTKRDILRKSQRYTVNVFADRLSNGNIIYMPDSGVYVLNESYYNDVLGMTEEVSNLSNTIF